MGRAAAIFLLVVVPATPAMAQELTAMVTTYGAFGLNDLNGDLPTSAELRLTVPTSKTFAVEPFGTVWSRGTGVEGLYGVQVRQRIVPIDADRGYVFATYGAAGYSYRGRFESGVAGLFGLGLHHRVTAHLSVRSDLQLVTFYVFPTGARFSAGLSVHRRGS